MDFVEPSDFKHTTLKVASGSRLRHAIRRWSYAIRRGIWLHRNLPARQRWWVMASKNRQSQTEKPPRFRVSKPALAAMRERGQKDNSVEEQIVELAIQATDESLRAAVKLFIDNDCDRSALLKIGLRRRYPGRTTRVFCIASAMKTGGKRAMNREVRRAVGSAGHLKWIIRRRDKRGKAAH